MTLEQIEKLLLTIQSKVNSNASHIETLQTKVANCATKTELSEVKQDVSDLETETT
jgi:hypothetical protein